jgi:hypothetical protein
MGKTSLPRGFDGETRESCTAGREGCHCPSMILTKFLGSRTKSKFAFQPPRLFPSALVRNGEAATRRQHRSHAARSWPKSSSNRRRNAARRAGVTFSTVLSFAPQILFHSSIAAVTMWAVSALVAGDESASCATPWGFSWGLIWGFFRVWRNQVPGLRNSVPGWGGTRFWS